MRVSDRGVAFIAAHEGIVPYPYFDSKRVLTFGIGHTRSAGAPDPATLPKGVEQPMSKVIEVFRRDLKRFEDRVNKAVKVPLSQHEFDALVSFDFNTGGVQRARLTTLLNEGKRTEAADAFMGWSKPKEIIPRRRAEMNLFRSGTYGNGMANVYRANENGAVLWSTAKRVNVLDLMREGAPSKPAPAPASPKPDKSAPEAPARRMSLPEKITAAIGAAVVAVAGVAAEYWWVPVVAAAVALVGYVIWKKRKG